MADPVQHNRLFLGRVTSFDFDKGLGLVVAENGEKFAFHSTMIADGSRSIEVGTRVCFTIVPGKLGRLEARCLRALL